jgi:Mlc titration factor MtfA (ptsG expression regulator)
MSDDSRIRGHAASGEARLTASERAILMRNAPYATRLDEADRAELEALVRTFLDEKSFEGCGGLELTLEMRVTIAAQACRLLLHRQTAVYPDVDAILVYPSAYRPPSEENEDGIVVESEDEWIGESWTRGVVVLAWDEVEATVTDPLDGQNVVLHEFAHQLDAEDGSMNGTPDLGTSDRVASWARVLTAEFKELSRQLDAGRRSDIDAYGATDPAEFFAVVTEMFFGKSRSIKRRHPALYEQLAAFYRQDPAGERGG